MNPVHRHDQHQCTDKGFSIHHLRLGPRARGSHGSPRPSAPKSAQARRFGPHGATPKKLACELTLIPIDFEKNNLQATHPSATVWRAFLSFACRTPSLKSPTTSRSHPQIPKTLEKSLARSSVRPPWAPLWRSPSPRPHPLRTPRAPWCPPRRWCLPPRSPPPRRRRRRRRSSSRRRRRRPWSLLPRPTTGSSSQVSAAAPAFGHQPSNFTFSSSGSVGMMILFDSHFLMCLLQLRYCCTPRVRLATRTSRRQSRGSCLA